MAKRTIISSSVFVVKEILELSLNPWVIPFTLMTVLCCIYWLLALLGTIDMDALDIDLDLDSDADFDGDVGNGGGGMFTSFLKFVNATDVPLMIVVTFLSLGMWFSSLVGVYIFKPEGNWLLPLVIWLVGFVVSCLVIAVITKPLIPLFRAFKKGEDDEEPIIGCESEVVTGRLTESFGQVRVFRKHGAPALINCRLAEGDESLKKGDRVVVISRDEEAGVYVVKQI
ncbi:hypothetical protein ACFPK9_10170 [Rubritalea spongiae]|uniref:DUF1449 family protein n=1 Tax=Rubritalea spongiae TaxID=430797 RepID=A0ABW5E416_9BACT